MMPILHLPGEIIPGQYGPIRRVRNAECGVRTARPFKYSFAFTMYETGIPSVIQTTTGIPASAASMIASAANAGGTYITEAFAPVSLTASATVLKTGIP